jgi:hypothetical protein
MDSTSTESIVFATNPDDGKKGQENAVRDRSSTRMMEYQQEVGHITNLGSIRSGVLALMLHVRSASPTQSFWSIGYSGDPLALSTIDSTELICNDLQYEEQIDFDFDLEDLVVFQCLEAYGRSNYADYRNVD